MHTVNVIAIDMPKGTAYLADHLLWDASWHTYDINKARRYVRKANAERVIKSYGGAWDTLRPRVVAVPGDSTTAKLVDALKTFDGDHVCPECGSEDFETNGQSVGSVDLTVRCCDCEHQWEPNA